MILQEILWISKLIIITLTRRGKVFIGIQKIKGTGNKLPA